MTDVNVLVRYQILDHCFDTVALVNISEIPMAGVDSRVPIMELEKHRFRFSYLLLWSLSGICYVEDFQDFMKDL